MKPPDQVKKEFVRQWLAKADADLRTSQHLLSSGPAYVLGTAFHAQQAAEKYLKSFLVWHQVEFPKTHDIFQLLELIVKIDKGLSDEVSAAAALTPYAVESRYPAEIPEPSHGQAEEAVASAEAVRRAVLNRLPAEFAGGQ